MIRQVDIGIYNERNNIKANIPSRDVLLTMLRLTLLEIRATDKVELANALADIFLYYRLN